MPAKVRYSMKHTPFLLVCTLYCGVALLSCSPSKGDDDTAFPVHKDVLWHVTGSNQIINISHQQL